MGLMLFSVAYSPLPFASPAEAFFQLFPDEVRRGSLSRLCSKHREFRGRSPGNPMTDLRHELVYPGFGLSGFSVN